MGQGCHARSSTGSTRRHVGRVRGVQVVHAAIAKMTETLTLVSGGAVGPLPCLWGLVGPVP